MYNLEYIRSDGKEFSFSRSSGIFVTSVEGATGHSVTLNTSQGHEQVGDAVQSATVSGQLLTISGWILRNNTTKRNMLRIFVPLTYGRLYWDNKYYIDVYVRDTPTIQQNRHAEFIMALYAPYPYWLKSSECYYDVGGLTPQFMFPINYASPHRFGTYISGSQVNAVNEGDSSTIFNLTITAGNSNLVNFGIINIHTMKFLRFTGTLEAGNTLNVYRDGGQLYIKSGTTDAFDILDDTSDLFELDAGDNVLMFTAEEGAATAKVAISFHEPYAGVLIRGM